MAFQEDESANGLHGERHTESKAMTGQPSFLSLHLLSLERVGSARKVPLKDSQSAQMAEREAKFNKERTMN